MKRLNSINFFCVGAQKSGTTTLHDILNQHPQVFLPKKKEAHFFDMDDRFKKGFSWYYNEFFSEYRGQKICGSCNPEYMYFEKVPNRLFQAFGDNLKLVFIFRNPVDRAFSHYLMSKRRLKETEEFERAISLEESRISKNYNFKSDFSYVSRGFYAKQLKRYLEYFPAENMFFIRFEDDFIQNREVTISNLLQFLEIDNLELNLNIKSNKAKSIKYPLIQKIFFGRNPLKKSLNFSRKLKDFLKKKLETFVLSSESDEGLSQDIKIELYKLYQNDILELEALTGMDFSNWKLYNNE